MTESFPTLTGRCQCGSLRYRINGEPLTLYLCHCRDCQLQASGAFGMSMRVYARDFELLSGNPKTWQTQGDTGTPKSCTFCSDCGSRICHGSSDDDVISIKAGSLDRIAELRPVAHIWFKRAHGWLYIDPDETPVFDTEPDDEELNRLWRDSGQLGAG